MLWWQVLEDAILMASFLCCFSHNLNFQFVALSWKRQDRKERCLLIMHAS